MDNIDNSIAWRNIVYRYLFDLFQTRPPLPAVPPPSESVYSEIEYRPYLDILPEDDDEEIMVGESACICTLIYEILH